MEEMPDFNYTDLSELGEPELIICRNGTSTINGVVSLATGLVVLVLALITISLNSLLLFIIFSKPLIRPLNALIANLSLVSILAAGLGAVYTCGLDTLFQDLWICSTFSFLRNVVTALISLSVLSISYERVRKVDSDSMLLDGKLLVSRTICCIWAFSLLGNIPALFVTIQVSHTHPGGEVHSICMKLPPGEHFGLGVIYEVTRSLVFHILVPGYMLFELYRIREAVGHFLHVTNPAGSQMQRKVRRVRFIYINSIIFILIWFPFGVGISIYKNTTLTQRYEKFINHPELDCEDGVKLGKKSVGFYILIFLFYSYIVLLPLLIFFSNDTFSSVQQMFETSCCCAWREKKSQIQNNLGSCPKEKQQGGQNGDCCDVEEGTKWKGDTTWAISESVPEIQLPECKLMQEMGIRLEQALPVSIGVVAHKPPTSYPQELLI